MSWPSLAVHQLGLDFAIVKLTFMDASIFDFVASIATYLLVQWISQHNILGFGIVLLVVSLTTLFYLALNWNKNIPVHAAYVLLVSLAVSTGNAGNFSLIGSLITKLTPVNSASFYHCTACCYDPQSCHSRRHIFKVSSSNFTCHLA